MIGLSFVIISQFFENNDKFEIFLNKSGPYIGINYPREAGLDGTGIKIALIDTGVDYNHPDLFGLGPDSKVVGGYDFVDNDEMPLDINGHGTEVAGIIAADGQLKGIAPKSKILAYRVSDDGESVSSELIIKAIEQAIIDKADVINISLGVNQTNKQIDDAVNKAVNQGIVVVTAAGNNGPGLSTIGSPGLNPNTITVGASYNNVSSSLVSTLEVNKKQFQAIPMVGTSALDEPIISEILFGKYGREQDLEDSNVENSILLVERGSDVENEIVYFSDKENNAANAGAKAILVFNNQPGIFLGELIHEFADPKYRPTIPALSMSNEDGLMLKELLQNKTIGTLHVFYHPDFVAHFSSRGPVSPFYIKPDLVAPGAFVNTTLIEGKYNFTSGTSFAAPHVTGAAAILLQKNPNFQPNEIKSLLVTTADFVSDPYGNRFPTEIAGTGRLNVTKAFFADLIIDPTYLTFNLSPEKQTRSEFLTIKVLDGNLENIQVRFEGNKAVNFEYRLEQNRLHITASLKEELLGKFEDRVIINHKGVTYNVPLLVHVSQASVIVKDQDGELNFIILYPENWSYTKISVTKKETGTTYTTSATPTKDASLLVYEPGEYWIESKIRTDEKTLDVYETVYVVSVALSNNPNFFEAIKIPEKPILIISLVVIIISLVSLKLRK